MTVNQEVWAALIAVAAVVNIPLLLHFLNLRTKPMADDLSKLTTAVDANTVAVNALIAAHGSASQQPAIDALTTQVTANNSAIDKALNPPVPLSVSPTEVAVSVGGTFTLSPSGGTEPYAYAPSDPGITVDANGAGTDVSAAPGSTSTITVTDAAGGAVSVAVTAS